MDDTGRRVPVFIRSTGRIVGTVISPINSPGATVETVKVGRIKATYLRRFEMQVYAVIIDTFRDALGLPSFEPRGGLKK